MSQACIQWKRLIILLSMSTRSCYHHSKIASKTNCINKLNSQNRNCYPIPTFLNKPTALRMLNSRERERENKKEKKVTIHPHHLKNARNPRLLELRFVLGAHVQKPHCARPIRTGENRRIEGERLPSVF